MLTMNEVFYLAFQRKLGAKKYKIVSLNMFYLTSIDCSESRGFFLTGGNNLWGCSFSLFLALSENH